MKNASLARATNTEQSPTCEAKRITQFDDELNQISTALDSFEKLVASLGETLQPVVHVSPPTPESMKASPEAMLVPLADSIRNRRRRLENLVARLGELHGAIEL